MTDEKKALNAINEYEAKIKRLNEVLQEAGEIPNLTYEDLDFVIAEKKPEIVKIYQVVEFQKFFVLTERGCIRGRLGDYIVCDSEGRRYVCNQKQFDEKFDVIDVNIDTEISAEVSSGVVECECQ